VCFGVKGGEGEVKGIRVGRKRHVSVRIFYPYSWCNKVFSRMIIFAIDVSRLKNPGLILMHSV